MVVVVAGSGRGGCVCGSGFCMWWWQLHVVVVVVVCVVVVVACGAVVVECNLHIHMYTQQAHTCTEAADTQEQVQLLYPAMANRAASPLLFISLIAVCLHFRRPAILHKTLGILPSWTPCAIHTSTLVRR